jgi:hypothetical protein
MTTDAVTGTGPADAWAGFATRLAGLAQRISRPPFPQGGLAAAEGARHLGRLVVFALQSFLEFDDPDTPAFHRYDDDVVKWGGPNADNVYLRARVRPDAAYRITGDVSRLTEMIVSVHEGDLQLGQYGVFAERTLAASHVVDGVLDLHLGGTEPSGDWLPLDERARYVVVRQYLSDWTADEPADLRIERIGGEGLPAVAPTPGSVAESLDRAATWIERSLEFWQEYMDGVATRQGPNVVSPPRPAPGGATDILYGGGIYDLADDEVLLIEVDAPEARYWSIQLYSMGWFESLDIANRQTSLNAHQAHVDADGRCRFVIAAHDPEVPNWLDATGHPRGMVAYRWVWSTTTPEPDALVVARAARRDRLPADHPIVDDAARRRAVALRQRHVARRFRR